MKNCIKCGSYAFNLYAEGIDQGGFCDVHYWQGRAQRAEAQPVQGLDEAAIRADEREEVIAEFVKSGAVSEDGAIVTAIRARGNT